MTTFLKSKTWLIKLLPFSPIIWLLLSFLFSATVLPPIYKQKAKLLQTELDSINLPPQTQLNRSETLVEDNDATIYNEYSTTLSYEKVLQYYETELAKDGWKFLIQRNTVATYCKGNYSANIYSYRPGYHLGLSVGQMSECEMLKGGAFIPVISFYQLWFGLGCSVSWLFYAVIILWGSKYLKQQELLALMNEKESLPATTWQARIGAVLIFIVSINGLGLSIYKLVMYLWNW